MTTLEAKMKGVKSGAYDIKTVRVKIVGDSPLITNRYNRNYWKHHTRKPNGEIEPMAEFAHGIYWVLNEVDHPESVQAAKAAKAAKTMDEFLSACSGGARYGIPASAIKRSAAETARRIRRVSEEEAQKSNLPPEDVYVGSLFFVKADDNSRGLIEIKSEVPAMREDLVKNWDGEVFSRYRPEFKSWSCEFDLVYETGGLMSIEDILNLINRSGEICGIGEWRPGCGGTFGTFHVEM